MEYFGTSYDTPAGRNASWVAPAKIPVVDIAQGESSEVPKSRIRPAFRLDASGIPRENKVVGEL